MQKNRGDKSHRVIVASDCVQVMSFIRYSENPYIKTLNFEGQAAVRSCLVITISNIRSLNRFLIYETLDVHDNLHFY